MLLLLEEVLLLLLLEDELLAPLTVIEKAGSALLAFPSLTLITILA